MDTYFHKTSNGIFHGLEKQFCYAFLGIPYAKAGRFEYASLIDDYGTINVFKPGPACMQKRAWPEFEHLEIPERAFYHKEYREGINFKYSEAEGLNLNIFMPKNEGIYPVIVFFHGGGFDSGCINESPFDGEQLARRGNVVVFIQYRVGVFGYFTHEEIQKEYGRDGNFGLDDMLKGLMWVNKNISLFRGDSANVTLMGQSAGAMSIQYLLCSKMATGLFHKAIMMSGAGLFPKFSLPRKSADTREYWLEVMKLAGALGFEDFKNMAAYDVLAAVEKQKALRKDNTYNTMPVIDDYILTDSIDVLIKNPLQMPLIIGFTNNDMFTMILANISKKYAKAHKAYLYYFDIDAKGDKNQAFHSADLRYVFGTLGTSWRPYASSDYKVSNLMMDYITSFAKTSDPNHTGAPVWEQYTGKAMHFTSDEVKMDKIKGFKLFKNTFKGDPK